MHRFADVAELQAHGPDLGSSGWVALDRDRLERYSSAVPGSDTVTSIRYLALSLIPVLSQQIWRLEVAMAVNAGLNTIRFGDPLPVGARIRLQSTLLSVRLLGTGALIMTREQLRTDEDLDPAVTAETLTVIRSS